MLAHLANIWTEVAMGWILTEGKTSAGKEPWPSVENREGCTSGFVNC